MNFTVTVILTFDDVLFFLFLEFLTALAREIFIGMRMGNNAVIRWRIGPIFIETFLSFRRVN